MERYIDLINLPVNKLLGHEILIKYSSEYHYLIHWLCKHDKLYNDLRKKELQNIAQDIVEKINTGKLNNGLKIKQSMIDQYVDYMSVDFHLNPGTDDYYHYRMKNNVIL